MGQPIRRTSAAVRAYSDTLRQLAAAAVEDPLDEAKSMALVTHVVNNRALAAQRMRELEQDAVVVPC